MNCLLWLRLLLKLFHDASEPNQMWVQNIRKKKQTLQCWSGFMGFSSNSRPSIHFHSRFVQPFGHSYTLVATPKPINLE